MRILLIEDDPKISRFVRKGLEADGHLVEGALDAEEGAAGLFREFDLVLLDLMLPKGSGLVLLRRLRERDPRTPVIVLTARTRVEDRVLGLEQGADDYLTKPFSFHELRARIRSLFRRVDRAPSRMLHVGDLVLDTVRRTVAVRDKQVDLSAREFFLLEYLVRMAGEPVTRAMIADRVWSYQFDTGTNVVDVYVSYVRAKLRSLGCDPIRTIRGIGYLLEPSACKAGDEATA